MFLSHSYHVFIQISLHGLRLLTLSNYEGIFFINTLNPNLFLIRDEFGLVVYLDVNASVKMSIFAETKYHFSPVGIVVYKGCTRLPAFFRHSLFGENYKIEPALTLLNQAREKVEKTVDELCQQTGQKRLRMYRKRARKDYLCLSKSKKAQCESGSFSSS